MERQKRKRELGWQGWKSMSYFLLREQKRMGKKERLWELFIDESGQFEREEGQRVDDVVLAGLLVQTPEPAKANRNDRALEYQLQEPRCCCRSCARLLAGGTSCPLGFFAVVSRMRRRCLSGRENVTRLDL